MVKSFKVNRFMVCEVSGITRIECEMQQGEVPRVDIVELSSRDNAINWLRKYERDWFFNVLENWLKHKLVLFKNNGDQSNFLLAQTFYDVATGELVIKQLCTAAKRIIAAKDKFMLLVPNPNNNSHESSLKDLNEILVYCEKAKDYDY